MSDLRYPIGKFTPPVEMTESEREAYIQDLEQLPQLLNQAVEGLTEQQLDTPYREGGWSVRQVVHHLADSHLNSYMRFRLALTEEEPTIKVYNEKKWAELPDAKLSSVDSSLQLIEGLHHRWVILLHSLSNNEWKKAFVHPELGRVPLDVAAALYAWHSKHHVAHITSLRERQDWK